MVWGILKADITTQDAFTDLFTFCLAVLGGFQASGRVLIVNLANIALFWVFNE